MTTEQQLRAKIEQQQDVIIALAVFLTIAMTILVCLLANSL
jgi:hypothetical protein